MQRPHTQDIIRWKIKLHLRQLTGQDDGPHVPMNTSGRWKMPSPIIGKSSKSSKRMSALSAMLNRAYWWRQQLAAAESAPPSIFLCANQVQ